ncbi:hypothetical protein C3K47_10495 [Solitalea longa]|uniref:Type IX secretion system membrane protein PorP/SprF n=1 Tax=Solitalea longa TaxID=2079460 RepID=A0A2S5A2I1_9SPHI|nr:PorP/SprF family type IX secretion system membrane protein [Solitalea longa]POY36776.1 hypothetical protein C3K47_10495 [Solitalea longa]
MKLGYKILVTVLLIIPQWLQAQDHNYSQFFNSPIYLNPSLTGQFEGDLRFGLTCRNQWSALAGSLSSFTFSADYKVPDFGGGIGLMATRSVEGYGLLTKNNLAATFSYSVGSDDLVFSFGLQTGVANRAINWSKLVFADQLDAITGILPGIASGATPPVNENKLYFDIGAGSNLVYKNFMIGANLQHLNKPDESLTGVSSSNLPIRSIVHASFILPLNSYFDDSPEIIPSVVFYKQTKFQSISAGFQYKHKNVNVGLWYRGKGFDNSDAMVISAIFDLFPGRNKVRLGLSHDATLSKVKYANTAGTTEASFLMETDLPNHDNSRRRFDTSRNCYDFY